MRRRLVLAGAGLALLLGGSLGLVAWLTGAPPPRAGSEAAAPAAPPEAPGTYAFPVPPPSVVPPGAAAVPDVTAPEQERRPMSTPRDRIAANRKTEARLRRDLRTSLRAVEPKLVACAREERRAPGSGKGRTVLAVVLEVRGGRAFVADVLVHRRGPDSDPVVHCARGAILGESFPVGGVESGTEIEVPLPMPIVGDDPDHAAR